MIMITLMLLMQIPYYEELTQSQVGKLKKRGNRGKFQVKRMCLPAKNVDSLVLERKLLSNLGIYHIEEDKGYLDY